MVSAVTRAALAGASYLHEWANILTADPAGDAISIPGASDRTVEITVNNLGASTLTMEGSNEVVPTTWFILEDTEHVDMVFTAVEPNMKVINANPLWIRPNLTVPGTAADWTVRILSRSTIR